MTRKKRARLPKLGYFFYNGDLHRRIHINRSADIITAWNYPKGKMEKYIYSDVRKNGGKAFSTIQVCEMVCRKRITVERAIWNGYVNPQFTYGLDEARNKYAYYWSEKDIMDLHAYLMTVHIGRPRADGMVTTGKLPTASELRAMIRQGTVLYVKNDAGEFVPTWQAEKF